VSLVLACRIKRRRTGKIAGVDRCAAREKKLCQRRVAGARCARKRHGAEAIARLERGAGFEETTCERHTTGVSNRRQRQIELRRRGVRLDRIEATLEIAAAGSVSSYGARNQG